LFLTFLSIYRLAGRMSVTKLLRFYFWIAVAHSFFALAPFVATGGAQRSFGLTTVFFDDFAMIALPIGLSYFLTSRPKMSRYYLVGSFVVLGGLVATQARAAIVFALVASAFVVVAAWWRSSRAGGADISFVSVRRRCRAVAGSFAALVILVGVFQSEIFAGVLERFGELFEDQPTGTTVFRLALWKRALMAFADHPIFGVGPGGYYQLKEVYATLHLTPVFHYLRTLGAHSPMLHTLAEQGIIGGVGLLALLYNHFRLGRRTWVADPSGLTGTTLALYAWGFLFAMTMILEAGWLWGPASFPGILMVALMVRHSSDVAARAGSQRDKLVDI
jgi:O-antigen ligase